MSKGTVGVIGLGIMGGAIAKNLAAAGWQVIGFDIAKERCAEAKAAGVEIARDVAAVAGKATNILVSLPKPGDSDLHGHLPASFRGAPKARAQNP